MCSKLSTDTDVIAQNCLCNCLTKHKAFHIPNNLFYTKYIYQWEHFYTFFLESAFPASVQHKIEAIYLKLKFTQIFCKTFI